jgi:hypothetical protein
MASQKSGKKSGSMSADAIKSHKAKCTCQPDGTLCPEAAALLSHYHAWVDTPRQVLTEDDYAVGMALLRAYIAHGKVEWLQRE